MKNYISKIIILAMFLSMGCKTTSTVKVPPGQIKKATGAKSAKPFAPGQKKKKKKDNSRLSLQVAYIDLYNEPIAQLRSSIQDYPFFS